VRWNRQEYRHVGSVLAAIGDVNSTSCLHIHGLQFYALNMALCASIIYFMQPSMLPFSILAFDI